jgi:hypothetical protein
LGVPVTNLSRPSAAGAPDRSNVEVRTEPSDLDTAENGCVKKTDGRRKTNRTAAIS